MAQRMNLRFGLVCGWLAIAVSIAPVGADEGLAGGSSRLTAAAVLDERIAAGDLQYRDPRTGDVVVATAERVAALRNELAPLFDWPQVFPQEVRADGTVRIVAEGQVHDVYLMRTNIDGRRDFACVNDLDGAVAFLIGADGAHDGGDQTRRPVVD